MLSVACFSLYELDPAPGLEFRLVTRVVILTYLLVVGIAILRDVFLEENVDYNIICGALCIYFIVGLLFSHLYQLVYDLHPACFHIDWQRLGLDEPNNPIVRSHLLAYYSFITLGTVGCGDVTPTGPITRTLSWFEAVLGQIYLTVLVARLVGMYVVGITTKNRDDLSIESTRLAD